MRALTHKSARPAMLLTALTCTMALGGCLLQPEAAGTNSVWRDDIRSPVQREISLKAAETTHILHANDGRLARGEAGRLGAFLAAHGTPWSMDVRIQPLSGEGAAAVQDAASALIQLGVQRTRISAMQQPGNAAGEGDIAITARYVEAAAEGCPDWRRSNLMDISELNSSNFGCATADHLARMVADPRDLASGRALAPATGEHASAAIERYRTDKVKPLKKRKSGGSSGSSGGGGK